MKAKNIFIILILTIACLLGAISLYLILNSDSGSTALEIEKKYLLDKDKIPYDLSKVPAYNITQTYINYSPEIRVRKIGYNGTDFYTMAIKRYVNDEALVREETEFDITAEEYNSTVVRGLDNTILKDRYQLRDENGFDISIDIFKGEFDGLAYLEIEFESEEAANAYNTPEWVIKDVTNDKRYKNGSLARYGIPKD